MAKLASKERAVLVDLYNELSEKADQWDRFQRAEAQASEQFQEDQRKAARGELCLQLEATAYNRTRTIAELAKEVLEVQNACNLSGVVLSWAQSILDLRANSPGASTDTLNHHPINVMWAEKVSELTGAGFRHDAEAFGACQKMAAGL